MSNPTTQSIDDEIIEVRTLLAGIVALMTFLSLSCVFHAINYYAHNEGSTILVGYATFLVLNTASIVYLKLMYTELLFQKYGHA